MIKRSVVALTLIASGLVTAAPARVAGQVPPPPAVPPTVVRVPSVAPAPRVAPPQAPATPTPRQAPAPRPAPAGAPPTPATPAPPPAPAQGSRLPPTMLQNIELRIVITDTISNAPQEKRVTMMLASGRSGSIRHKGFLHRDGAPGVAVEIALDAQATTIAPDLVQAQVTFTYAAPPAPVDATAPGAERNNAPAEVSESLVTLLRSGRPLVVSRSADPVTNRSVTVELTATISEP